MDNLLLQRLHAAADINNT